MSGGISMKKKLVLTIAFVISLSPMLLNQYGGRRGIQEISGVINLLNPIGVVAVLLFAIGVWLPLNNQKINNMLGGLGVSGIVISELYEFFTWHIKTITGELSLRNSIRFAFPEFYIGLAISVAMVCVYFFVDKIVRE